MLAMKKVYLATSCLLCIIVMWKYGFFLDYEGTEFSGGWLTGPLLHLYDLGGLTFVLALLLAFFYRRIASVTSLASSLLCLPLLLYFTAPGPFRRVFSMADFPRPLRSNFVWNKRVIVGILTLAVAMSVALWNLGLGEKSRSRSSPRS
jgi:hypothetical protein